MVARKPFMIVITYSMADIKTKNVGEKWVSYGLAKKKLELMDQRVI